jgi:hypothetical protein
MGNDIRNKGLLLDEADFALPSDCTLETLAESVLEFCQAAFSNEFDNPSLEFYGVVAEGFPEEDACAFHEEPTIWLEKNMGFRGTFLKLADGLGIPEEKASQAIKTGHGDLLEDHLKIEVMRHLDDRDYHEAEALMLHLPGVREIGLPGVLHGGHFDKSGRDVIVDYRVNNYGPGRRILAEIGFNWGQ